jgi:exodeoxyribonuclease VII small subunit
MSQPLEQPKELNFEASFARLEEILEKMNSSAVSLDDALKLFEEADKLITSCSKKLTDAERKVEILIKNRATGELVMGNEQRPATQDFAPPK